MKGSSDFQISNGILYNYIGPGGDVVVPDGVTVITGHAFERRRLQSVRLPEGLKEIGAGAFRNCSTLDEIHIPKSVTHIEAGAFGSCRNLTNILVEKGNPCFTVQDGFLLEKRTLSCCPGGKRGRVVIPDGVKRVPGLAFDGCRKITELIFPDSVNTINCDAFQNSYALRRVVLPAKLKQLYAGTFQNCAALEEIVLPDTLEKIGKYAFTNSGLRRVTLPAALQNVCKGAFENCVHLEEVVILSAAVHLARDAFSICPGLRHLTITGTPHITPSMFPQPFETVIADDIPLADLPKGFFKDAAIVTLARRILAGETPPKQDEHLKYIKNQRKSLYTLAVNHEELLQLMFQHKFFTSKDIQPLLDAAEENISVRAAILEYQNRNGGPPDPFEEMEREIAQAERVAAYVEKNGILPVSELKKIWGYKKLEDGTLCITSYKGTDTSVTIPDKIGRSSVTAISTGFLANNAAARQCVTTFLLPKSLTCIGIQAFGLCTGLTSIDIPSGVTEIESFTFKGCTNLSHITIPDSVKKIGTQAFSGCESLKAVSLSDRVTSIGSMAFAPGTVIQASAGSYAETYAETHQLKFIKTEE